MIWGPLIALMLSQQPDSRCTLRISANGIYVDGDAATPARAIATCKRTSGAIVIVEDDAPADAWPAMHARLKKARIEILMRGQVGDFDDCAGNPLAKGCL